MRKTDPGCACIGPAILFASLLVVGLLPPTASSVSAAETHTEFNLRKDVGRKENIFNLIFGSAPPLATERGILLIDAYHDRNGNGRRDPGEDDLDREIFCLVDDVEYDVPALIPGLAYRGSYKVLCAGERYAPVITKEDLFIERHGQIVRIDIPCRTAAAEESLLP